MDHQDETEMERKTRTSCGFPECESSLPNIKLKAPHDTVAAVADNVLSYLGTHNPLAHPIAADNTLWLFDNTAYRNPTTHEWEAEFVAAVFEKDTSVGVDDVVAAIAGKLGIAKGDKGVQTIRERVRMFTREILPGRKVEVVFELMGKEEVLHLGPGGRNAISSDVRKLPGESDGDVFASKARVPMGTDGHLDMKTVYAEPEGWAVISDIDDTIKITATNSPLGILESTFVSEPTPVFGMPELYSWISSLVSTGSSRSTLPFLYLSASPYNLYPFLRGFREKYYPTGTIILRDASWMNLAGLLSNLTLGVQAYKVDRMKKIHGWLPKRKMICIGDSTQSDPEAYAEIYKKYPDWIHLILIRKVTDVSATGLTEKDKPERFEKAFAGIPSTVWKVFDTPDECRQNIEKLVQSGGNE